MNEVFTFQETELNSNQTGIIVDSQLATLRKKQLWKGLEISKFYGFWIIVFVIIELLFAGNFFVIPIVLLLFSILHILWAFVSYFLDVKNKQAIPLRGKLQPFKMPWTFRLGGTRSGGGMPITFFHTHILLINTTLILLTKVEYEWLEQNQVDTIYVSRFAKVILSAERE